MTLKIIKQYVNKDIKILFLYVLDGNKYLFLKPIKETRAYEEIPTSFCIDDALFNKMKEVNKDVKKIYKNYTVPYVNNLFIENDDLTIYNKNELFMKLYVKIIYHLKTKKYKIDVDKKQFIKFYNTILNSYFNDKYIIVDFDILYVMDNEMLSKLNYILTNDINHDENIIFKNDIDIFDDDIIINQHKIKNVYYEKLQDLDLFYYYFKNNLFIVSKVSENKNESFDQIIENKSGYNNGFYFKLVV